jgi:hypothetical protein
VKTVMRAGSAAVSCAAGSGALSIEFVSSSTATRGFSVGRAHTITATCANSLTSTKSSCSISNNNGTVVAPTLSGGVVVTSPEWDGQCVCRATGRRPVLLMRTAGVLSGAACTA